MLRLLLTAAVAIAACGFCPTRTQADEAAERSIRQARQALADREFEAARTALATAKTTADATQTVTVERLGQITDLLVEFFAVVDRGGQNLQATEELLIGETRVAVVEYEGGRLVLRVAGRNLSYTLKETKAKVTKALFERGTQANSARAQLLLGAFEAMDRYGDRQLARQHWQQAAAGGQSVDKLLAELDAPSVVVALPELNLAQQRALAPRGWFVRFAPDGRVKHSNLTPQIARQSREGRLEVTNPEGSGTSGQLVLGRRMAGDFTLRAIIAQTDSGQRLGLFTQTGKDGSATVELVGGTVEVEFARSNGKITAKVNGEEVPVTVAGEFAESDAGRFGITLDPGQEITIAALDVQ